jgi:formyltetrahydrofolate synthetase
VLVICKSHFVTFAWISLTFGRYALAADIQTIPGLPTAPGYLNVDVDPITGEIDGLF